MQEVFLDVRHTFEERSIEFLLHSRSNCGVVRHILEHGIYVFCSEVPILCGNVGQPYVHISHCRIILLVQKFGLSPFEEHLVGREGRIYCPVVSYTCNRVSVFEQVRQFPEGGLVVVGTLVDFHRHGEE